MHFSTRRPKFGHARSDSTAGIHASISEGREYQSEYLEINTVEQVRAKPCLFTTWTTTAPTHFNRLQINQCAAVL